MVRELLVSFIGTQTLKKLQTLIHVPLAFNQELIFFDKENKTVTPSTVTVFPQTALPLKQSKRSEQSQQDINSYSFIQIVKNGSSRQG